jgi:hypothetical protein
MPRDHILGTSVGYPSICTIKAETLVRFPSLLQQVAILQAILVQFTIVAHPSKFVKGFPKNFPNFIFSLFFTKGS